MKDVLERLFQGETLSEAEAAGVLERIAAGEFTDPQVAAFLTVFKMRPVSVAELAGFRSALLRLAVQVDIDEMKAVDLCGTGGDGKDTFNISTLSAFVVAGAGYRVVKHGNYSVSSHCGSSNVLEALGVQFSNNIEVLRRRAAGAGVCFLHAPLFHPAMKNIGPVRKALGFKTIFNLLGPLVNPAQPDVQMIGVYSYELMRPYSYVLQQTDVNYAVVHSLDGYDEISLTGPVQIISRYGELALEPEDLGFEIVTPESLSGGKTVGDATAIFESILSGTGSVAQRNVVAANAGVAIALFYDEPLSRESILRGISEAQDSLSGGKALVALQQVQQLSREEG